MNDFTRGTIKRYLEGPGYVFAVEVPVLYSPEEPNDPCLQPAAVKFLDEAMLRIDANDTDWLEANGTLYWSQSA